MIESYVVLAERIRKELHDLERLVSRAKRALATAGKNPQDADLFIDSASLNLHDLPHRMICYTCAVTQCGEQVSSSKDAS